MVKYPGKFETKEDIELVVEAAKLKKVDPRVYIAQASIEKAKLDIKEGGK